VNRARGFRFVASCLVALVGQPITLGHSGESPLLVCLVGPFVAVLDVYTHETVKVDDGAAGGEPDLATVGGGGLEKNPDPLPNGVLHLRRQGPLPDQLVQPGGIAIEFAGHFTGDPKRLPCGTDRLMCLLRVARLRGIEPRLGRQILGSVYVRDLGAGGGECGA